MGEGELCMVKKKNYILQGGGVGGKEIELCIRKNYSTERGTWREGEGEEAGIVW